MILLAFILGSILPFLGPMVFKNAVSLTIYTVTIGLMLSFLAFGMLDETIVMTHNLALNMQLLFVIATMHLLGVFARFVVLGYRKKHAQPVVEWVITLAFALVAPLTIML